MLGDVINSEPAGKSMDVLEQSLVDGDEARRTEIEGGLAENLDNAGGYLVHLPPNPYLWEEESKLFCRYSIENLPNARKLSLDSHH